MTLLRELIDIPEQVHRGDFVLRLTEGVTRPKETLGSYVVTDQLRTCFDDALAFIRSALESGAARRRTSMEALAAGRATSWRSFTRCFSMTRRLARSRRWHRCSPATAPGSRASASCSCPTT